MNHKIGLLIAFLLGEAIGAYTITNPILFFWITLMVFAMVSFVMAIIKEKEKGRKT
jgi:uncharacterized membrane protein YcaP (DUF421 family)